jgi:hypothetical protein
MLAADPSIRNRASVSGDILVIELTGHHRDDDRHHDDRNSRQYPDGVFREQPTSARRGWSARLDRLVSGTRSAPDTATTVSTRGPQRPIDRMSTDLHLSIRIPLEVCNKGGSTSATCYRCAPPARAALCSLTLKDMARRRRCRSRRRCDVDGTDGPASVKTRDPISAPPGFDISQCKSIAQSRPHPAFGPAARYRGRIIRRHCRPSRVIKLYPLFPADSQQVCPAA